MIDLDYGPLALLLPVLIVFTLPNIYSYFIDRTDKS